MCFDNVPNGRHECIDPCPICYLFTISNTRLLLRGDTIPLGTFELFSEVARVGCRLCAMLCRIWHSNEEGFKRDAQVRVFIPKEMLKGKIWTLYFEIDQAGFNGSPFGEESGDFLREEKRSSWAVPIGVFTKGTKHLDHVFPVRAPVPSVSHDDVFEQFGVVEALRTVIRLRFVPPTSSHQSIQPTIDAYNHVGARYALSWLPLSLLRHGRSWGRSHRHKPAR